MPFSIKQREFFDRADHRWNFKTGATRSGKTYMDYYMIPKRIRRRIGRDGLAVILGVSKGTIERNLLDPMRTLYGDTLVGVISNDNTCYLFGERVHCLGAEKVSQVSKLRGSSIKYCYGDEVADWNPEVFELLKSRLDKPYSCFDGALNPQGPNHWLKKFLESDADIYQQHYTIFDNPFLPKEFVDNLCKEYEGTMYYKRYILGEWALADGLVYDMFSPEKNVYGDDDRPLGLPYIASRAIAVDYGTTNPTVFLDIYDDGEIVRVDNEYRWDSRERSRQKTDAEYADDLELFMGDDPQFRCAVVVDPSAASFIVELQRRGIYVIQADNDVLNGIRRTAQLFNRRVLMIHTRCAGLLKEIGSYVWDAKAAEVGEDKPVKALDHGPDALRYYVNTILPKWRYGEE